MISTLAFWIVMERLFCRSARVVRSNDHQVLRTRWLIGLICLERFAYSAVRSCGYRNEFIVFVIF
jgi:hypothetical protein